MYKIWNNYLIINRNVFENLLLYNLKNVKKDTIDSLREMCLQLVGFENEKVEGHVSQIAIKKDSIIANWIIESLNTEMKNSDYEISYDKIVNAILISMHQDDYKISNKIMPLFQNNLSGSREELLNQGYSESILDYICTNSDFEAYLESVNKEIAIYEEEKITLKRIVKDTNKNM